MKRLLLILMAVLVCFVFSRQLRSSAAIEYDVVVVGAGGGGLGAAAKLARAGMKVLVLEQHDKVGGYMTAFERPPYVFEVSLHALDGLNQDFGMNRPLFRELGILDKVKLVELDPFYRAIYPDFTMDVPTDPVKYKALLIAQFPQEKKGIEKLFRTMDNMGYAIQALIALQSGDQKTAGMTLLKHPLALWPMKKYSKKSLSRMMDNYIHDPKLRAVFTWLCNYAGVPPEDYPAEEFLGMWASYHYGGAWYVVGGSQAVSNALAKVIEENGGKVETGSLVTKIVIENGRAAAVQTRDGREYRARYVVSNANAPDTMNKLVGRENLPPEYLAQLDSLRIGPSIFQVYLGVDYDYRPIFGRAHCISVAETYDTMEGFSYGREGVPEKVGYALVNYSVVDPGAAPEGKNVIGITTYMPYDWQNGWHENESYEKYKALKEEVALILVRRAEKILPGLSSHVEVMEVGSPRTMEHFTLNPKGAVYGWDSAMDQKGKRLPQQTPIPNLFLAGAWTNAAGQNGVMRSGVTAANKILEREKGARGK
ncbi:MAG TPA: NAD(P)/FAD-dependent oxidoreductase [bacterium]|nr:NAD(P)/FAD-dependent oxidoreductase [bacterium]